MRSADDKTRQSGAHGPQLFDLAQQCQTVASLPRRGGSGAPRVHLGRVDRAQHRQAQRHPDVIPVGEPDVVDLDARLLGGVVHGDDLGLIPAVGVVQSLELAPDLQRRQPSLLTSVASGRMLAATVEPEPEPEQQPGQQWGPLTVAPRALDRHVLLGDGAAERPVRRVATHE